MPTPIINDEQAAEMREQLAAYERRKAYEAALARHQVYLAIKPLVDSQAFISIHQQIDQFRAEGPKDDSYFGVGIEAIYQGMTALGIQVANWTEPTEPAAPADPDGEPAA
mgnify:CR=1 FL=1